MLAYNKGCGPDRVWKWERDDVYIGGSEQECFNFFFLNRAMSTFIILRYKNLHQSIQGLWRVEEAHQITVPFILYGIWFVKHKMYKYL